MEREIIDAVTKAGFDVYMRNEADTWLLFTDGTHIGYIERNRLNGGVRLGSVHKPSREHGTGFEIAPHLPLHNVNREHLLEAFKLAPSWARDVGSVKKFHSFEAYRSANSFNAEYRLVARAV